MKALNFLLSYLWSLTQLKFIKSEIGRMVGYSILFSVMMVIVRIVYAHELTFISMIWNLFLAYIPYQLLQSTTGWIVASRNKPIFAIIFMIWLLFVPNTFYLITDLFHLYPRERVPLWFDLALLMSLAWNGLVLGLLSIRQMEKLMKLMVPRLPEWLFVSGIMFLNSLGVYLGRYLRFNSWDIVANPFQLFSEMIGLLQYKDPWAMVICYTMMMVMMYRFAKTVAGTSQFVVPGKN